MANSPRPSEQLGKNEHNISYETGAEVMIVGAGPSGLAVAACLQDLGISSLVIERESCLVSLWKYRTYDQMKLHIDKKSCALPLMPFPDEYPMFVTKNQFIVYLEEYAKRLNIQTRFGQSVESASFFQETGTWHVIARCSSDNSKKEYIGRFLVVATGENSEFFMPDVSGMKSFAGTVIHSINYKNVKDFEGKKVLVIGCGNSGMEIALELANNDAGPWPSMVVRSPNSQKIVAEFMRLEDSSQPWKSEIVTCSVRITLSHVLPREVFGRSTFSVAMQLLKLLPLRLVDNLLIMYSNLILGDTSFYGIPRPLQGPLEMKFKTGKTPVLDNGTVAKIREGKIKVVRNLNRVTATGVEFEDNHEEDFDALIFATGYRSEVRRWLKNGGELFWDDGFRRKPSPNNWKGSDVLYAAGFGGRGLMGSSSDAQLIAQHIFQAFRSSS